MLLAVKGVTLTEQSFDSTLGMYLVKRKLAFGLVLVCYVVFFLAVSEDAGMHTTFGDHYAHEAAVTGSSIAWAEAILDAQDAPPMALLLTRLQGIQSFLYLLESEHATHLSASLALLSQRIEQQFEQRLYTPFSGLSEEQRKIYSDVLQVVMELEKMMSEVEEAGEMPAYEVDQNLAS